MRCRFHFALAAVTALVALLLPVEVRAVGTVNAVGRIEGSDISIDGAAVGVNAPDAGYVSNGNVVTVHEGQARFRLEAGGVISICGPAKFTVLQSGGAITLALEFGRMHMEIPAAVSLRIFTPSIVATPLDIRGGTRDLTVGLDQNDSLCVIASSGAVRLEQQLSGEHVIIPEAGDFSISGAQLLPVANAGRSCQCAATPEAMPSPAPRAAPPQIASAAPAESVAPDAPSPAAAAAVAQPVHQIDVPVTFSAAGAANAPPSTPTAESAMLVRVVRADPNWEFTGHVESSEFARDLSRSLGVGRPGAQAPPLNPSANAQSATPQSAASGSPNAQAPAAPAQKPRRSLWAAFKSIF
jgi:hypothetical protein